MITGARNTSGQVVATSDAISEAMPHTGLASSTITRRPQWRTASKIVSLSSGEVGQGYREVADPSQYAGVGEYLLPEADPMPKSRRDNTLFYYLHCDDRQK